MGDIADLARRDSYPLPQPLTMVIGETRERVARSVQLWPHGLGA